MIMTFVAALTVGGGITLLVSLASRRTSKLDSRLKGLQGKGGTGPEPEKPKVSRIARSAIPKMGHALVPENEEQRTRLQARLVHAGMYGRQSMAAFLGIKMLLMVSPAILGLIAGILRIFPMRQAVLVGACLGVIGMIGPGFWLDSKKKKRQVNFRRALPDALDVIVICLEGGLSLPGALRRVAGELRAVHPQLAAELDIVLREVQLGRSTGDALRNLGERSDLEELRSLASVIIQAERYGAGLIKSLRVHADTLRLKRQQRAEELAQKAATKVLIPTLLFIFPAIFIVILGPAAIQISRTLLTD
jgi:tight adherence protein C